MKYFAYGSNMSYRRILQRTPSAVPLGTFSLQEHRLLFHKVGQDSTAKCNAFHTHDPANTVLGRLYEIDATEKHLLDLAEGLGNGYEEKTIKVFNTTKRNAVKATMYYAIDIDSTLKPFTWYKHHVLIGAKEAGLPTEYVGIIESVPAIRDYDVVREMEQLALY